MKEFESMKEDSVSIRTCTHMYSTAHVYLDQYGNCEPWNSVV